MRGMTGAEAVSSFIARNLAEGKTHEEIEQHAQEIIRAPQNHSVFGQSAVAAWVAYLCRDLHC
jgi:hypothetical protein